MYTYYNNARSTRCLKHSYCYTNYSYFGLVNESCILINLKFVLVLKHAIIQFNHEINGRLSSLYIYIIILFISMSPFKNF